MKERLYVALDTPSMKDAEAWATQLEKNVGGLKLGPEFLVANGPAGVERMSDYGLSVFLDLKLHDTPRTVAATVYQIVHGMWGVGIVSVHASGGQAMMEAAANVAARLDGERPKIVAATVLTSVDEGDLAEIGQDPPLTRQVLALAALARHSGLDGAIVPPHTCRPVRDFLGPDFLLITPGIRPDWAREPNDHRKVATPSYAIQAGADIIVVGRPVIMDIRPGRAARTIVRELKERVT